MGPTQRAVGRRSQGGRNMLTYKIISAAGAMAMGAAVVLVMPGFSPEADASMPAQVVESTDIRPTGNCTQQAWPYYKADCLRDRNHGQVRSVRIVTTDRVAK